MVATSKTIFDKNGHSEDIDLVPLDLGLLMAAAISAQHSEAVVLSRDEITKTTKQWCYGLQKSREYAFRV